MSFADHDTPQAEYVIPGERVTSLESFYTLVGEAVNGPGGYFGGNLDAFVDCLRGGFGTPDEGFVIRWQHSEASKKALGYPETVRQLELRLTQCQPDNIPFVSEDLERARRGQGPTVFDWLVEIICEVEGVELKLE